MHPAPSLAESFPKNPQLEERSQSVSSQHDTKQQQKEEKQQEQQRNPHSHQHHRHHHHHQPSPEEQDGRSGPTHLERSPISPGHSSPPPRKDTVSSTSTNDSDMTVVTEETNDTNGTNYSVQSSQSIFSVKDGAEVANNRRASRRRTGPLSAQQREKAALIRKLGACADCRRRRVAVSR
jgi:hypothetical protein